MSSNFYDVGDRVTAYVTFRDENGAVGDPDDPTLLIQGPDGTVTSVTEFASHVAATGYYEHAFDIDQAGRWELRWQGVGPITAAEGDRFFVRQQNVIPETS